MLTVTVDLPAPAPAAYGVHVGSNLLANLGERVRTVAPGPSAVIVSDDNVAKRYLTGVKASLEAAGYRVIPCVIPAGEAFKTLATASNVMDQVLVARVERRTPVVALGGGVVGDLGGFVAATLLRGLPFIQVPTTLLAAVDASVGGKVGVDHAAGKNLIGAFHQPRAVITDIDTFQTLPERELKCGLAECIKHGIIRDAGLFDFIEQHAMAILKRDAQTLAELVAWNVCIKAAVVGEDPFEHGVRALLNLGHTFGHAFETVLDYRAIQHGEAVAVGMTAAGNLAVQMGLLKGWERDRMVGLIGRVGLPTGLKQVDPAKVFAAMGTDKKVVGGKLRLILPTGIGAARIESGVDEARVRGAIASVVEDGGARGVHTA